MIRNGAAQAFQPFLLSLQERIERWGWDKRPEPAHVQTASMPSFPGLRMVRCLAVAGVTFTLASAIPSANVANSIEGMASPTIGIYTWLDILPRIGSDLLTSAMPGTHAASGDGSWVAGYVVSIIACAIVGFVLGCATLAIPTSIPGHLRGTVRDDKWCSLNDLVEAKLLGHNEPGIVVGAVQPPPLFGIVPRKPLLLVDSNPAHVLMESHSRGGKDVGPIAFTLAKWPFSAIVTDNKNEQYQLTSGLARDYYGKNVYRLCLQAGARGDKMRLPNGDIYEEHFGTSKHNILDEIPWGTDREYASVLQAMTVMVAKKMSLLDDGENGHWYRTSRVVGMALAYKVAYDPAETLKSLSRVAMLLSGDDAQSNDSRELKKSMATDGGEVDSIHDVIEHYLGFSATGQGTDPQWLRRALDNQRTRTEAVIANQRKQVRIKISETDFAVFERAERAKLAQTLERIRNFMHHPDMERAVRNTMRIRGEEAGSVYSTINAVMTPWLDPMVIENTRTSTYRWLDINNAERPAVLYLVNPPDYGDMYQACYRVELEIGLRLQVPQMRQDNETKRMFTPHKYQTIWIINEPMTVGEIPALVPILPFAASFSHRFFFAYQLSSQKIEQFGENEPLTGNSMTRVLHAPNDAKGQEEVAKMLGERMVVTLDESRSGFQMPNHSMRASTIPVMTPPQVAQMPSDPKFRTRWDLKTRTRVPLRNPDGSLKVIRQAEQILSTRRGYAYTRKIQWFSDEFPGIYALIKKFAPAIPSIASAPTVPVQTTRTEAVETLKRPAPEVTLVPVTNAPRRYRAVAIAAPKQRATTNAVPTEQKLVPAAFKDILGE